MFKGLNKQITIECMYRPIYGQECYIRKFNLTKQGNLRFMPYTMGKTQRDITKITPDIA
jgi:hypothetical protein